MNELIKALHKAESYWQEEDSCFSYRIPGYAPEDIVQLLTQIQQHLKLIQEL